ncbi:MAG: DUF5666 domain-containing protein [Acidobacteriota bacterium]
MQKRSAAIAVILAVFVLCAGISTLCPLKARAQATTIAKGIGRIKTINGGTITLSPTSGSDIAVTVQPNARILRLTPGEKDLKNATPLQLQDLQVGDTIRVRGAGSEDGKTISALEVIVITSSAVAAVTDQVRQDWQKRGVGGMVDSVDTATATIHISVPRMGAKREVAVQTSKNTLIRRYAADSARPENAKTATIAQIRVGDQLRARGNRNADGSKLDAEEIYVGFFPQFSGIVKSVDANAGTLSVQDLSSKKTVEVRITPESRLHKVPAEIAHAFATSLKSMVPQALGGAPTSTGAKESPMPAGSAAGSASPNGPMAQGSRAGGMHGAGRDLQQIIARLPSGSLQDMNLQKGDAVVILATEGASSSLKTVITLLSGVEPILRAAPSASDAMMLSPWSLGGAPGGEASQ